MFSLSSFQICFLKPDQDHRLYHVFQKFWYFRCECERCADPTELGSHLRHLILRYHTHHMKKRGTTLTDLGLAELGFFMPMEKLCQLKFYKKKTGLIQRGQYGVLENLSLPNSLYPLFDIYEHDMDVGRGQEAGDSEE